MKTPTVRQAVTMFLPVRNCTVLSNPPCPALLEGEKAAFGKFSVGFSRQYRHVVCNHGRRGRKRLLDRVRAVTMEQAARSELWRGRSSSLRIGRTFSKSQSEWKTKIHPRRVEAHSKGAAGIRATLTEHTALLTRPWNPMETTRLLAWVSTV